MSSAAALRHFEIPHAARFDDGPSGLVRLRLHPEPARAELFPHGAHLTQFQPAGAAPVLFTSEQSHFAPGKAIRGGVPICFPWFGPRAGHPEAPMHGFARTRAWELEALTGSAEQGLNVTLRLDSDDNTRALWPHDFIARYRIEIGSRLTLSLEVENTGPAPFSFEAALHTYLAVSDVREISLTGLEGATYIDKTDAFTRKQLGAEPLRFTGETDRVFPGTTTTCIVEDPGLQRQIVVEKSGSQTTVIWNPWIAKAAAMADFGDDEWPRMLCVEAANAGDDAITLAPGARHTLTQSVRLA